MQIFYQMAITVPFTPAVASRIPETWCHLLIPYQSQPGPGGALWDEKKLTSGKGSLAERASERCVQEDLLFQQLGARRIRVNRHPKLHHFRHRKVSHLRGGLWRRFRGGFALAAPAVPLLAHVFRGWLRWLSSFIDAGGTSPAVTPQTSSAGIGGATPPIPAEEEPPACGRNSPDRRFSLSR